MTDAVADPAPTNPKSRKPVFALWLAFALVGAVGGFFLVRAGLIPIPGGGDHAVASHGSADAHGNTGHMPPADTVFVEIDPIMVSLTGSRGREHLRFRAQLEVDAPQAKEVARILPRIVDVLNGYLRALEPSDLQDPMALTRLRAQMLRRIHIVAGPGQVRDLLIMEFVLN